MKNSKKIYFLIFTLPEKPRIMHHILLGYNVKVRPLQNAPFCPNSAVASLKCLCQTQILILKILNVFLWLKFSPSLNLNKIEHFSKVSKSVVKSQLNIIIKGFRLTCMFFIDMDLFELKECCYQFSLLTASTESHL